MRVMRTRCEAVVAGHRLSMEYERCLEAGNDGGISLSSSDDEEFGVSLYSSEWNYGPEHPSSDDEEFHYGVSLY